MQAAKRDPEDPRLLALQVEAMLALDKGTKAQPLIEQLSRDGYRDRAFVVALQRKHIAYPVNAVVMQQVTHISGSN